MCYNIIGLYMPASFGVSLYVYVSWKTPKIGHHLAIRLGSMLDLKLKLIKISS